MRRYAATVSITVTASEEANVHAEHCDRFWSRVKGFGAHGDTEIQHLWSRVKREETRIEREVGRLWMRLEEYGATEDQQVRSLWKRIIG